MIGGLLPSPQNEERSGRSGAPRVNDVIPDAVRVAVPLGAGGGGVGVPRVTGSSGVKATGGVGPGRVVEVGLGRTGTGSRNNRSTAIAQINQLRARILEDHTPSTGGVAIALRRVGAGAGHIRAQSPANRPGRGPRGASGLISNIRARDVGASGVDTVIPGAIRLADPGRGSSIDELVAGDAGACGGGAGGGLLPDGMTARVVLVTAIAVRGIVIGGGIGGGNGGPFVVKRNWAGVVVANQEQGGVRSNSASVLEFSGNDAREEVVGQVAEKLERRKER